MSDEKMINVEQFIARECMRLLRFGTYWRQRQADAAAKGPDEEVIPFPELLPPGEWQEQFEFFEEE